MKHASRRLQVAIQILRVEQYVSSRLNIDIYKFLIFFFRKKKQLHQLSLGVAEWMGVPRSTFQDVCRNIAILPT